MEEEKRCHCLLRLRACRRDAIAFRHSAYPGCPKRGTVGGLRRRGDADRAYLNGSSCLSIATPSSASSELYGAGALALHRACAGLSQCRVAPSRLGRPQQMGEGRCGAVTGKIQMLGAYYTAREAIIKDCRGSNVLKPRPFKRVLR